MAIAEQIISIKITGYIYSSSGDHNPVGVVVTTTYR